MSTSEGRDRGSAISRAGKLIVLGFFCLYYLQFGLQALDDYLPQGILSLVGAGALGWGAVLSYRRRPASAIVLLGTLPILALHAVMTLDDPGELPFLVGSLPVPLVAALAWLVRRRNEADPAEVTKVSV